MKKGWTLPSQNMPLLEASMFEKAASNPGLVIHKIKVIHADMKMTGSSRILFAKYIYRNFHNFTEWLNNVSFEHDKK